MQTIGITITAFNEEENIRRCLSSVSWADEIVIMNCNSSDSTREIALKYTDKVFDVNNESNLNVNKNKGIDHVSANWVMVLDADEVVTDNLKDEIRKAINGDAPFTGYFIPRKNFYLDKWLKYGGNYPDYQLRLFKNGKGKFPALHVHERITLDGKAGFLKNEIEHYPYKSVSEYLKKFDFYTDFEAEFMKKSGFKIGFLPSINYFISKPLVRFIKRYLLKGGYKNGIPGVFAVLFDCLSYPVRYVKLWELYKNNQE